MKKIFSLILSFIFSNSLALSPYIGSYELYADTKMGNLKIGTAVLNLNVVEDQFMFTTEAKTESLWKALYDYSRSEKSTGNEVDGQVITPGMRFPPRYIVPSRSKKTALIPSREAPILCS